MQSSAEEKGTGGGVPENGKHMIAILAGYFALQLVSRILISDTANLDEAEQLILTQGLRWGYGSQPPLYTWLQTFFFTVFGTNIFALALLKNILIFGTYLFTYLSAEQITGQKRVGALAALGLLFVPQIVWESQRDLTHSVLTTSIAAATIFVAIKLFQTRKVFYYLMIGLCTALGMLSKYNYAVFLFALVFAAFSLREMRPALLNRRSLLTLAVVLLLTAGHFYWMFHHNEEAFTQSEKLQVSGVVGSLDLYAKGIFSLITAVAGFFLPLLLIHFLIFKWAAIREIFVPETETEKLLYRTVAFGLVFCLVAVFCFKARFKDRWMQPLLFVVPFYFSLRLSSRLSALKNRQFNLVSGLVAFCVLLVLPLSSLIGPSTNNLTRLNCPYSALVGPLKSQFRSGQIIAENRMVGGNLKFGFPESVVIVPDLTTFPAPENAALLVVWDATKKMPIPPQLAQFASNFVRADFLQMQAHYIESPYKYSTRQNMRLGFFVLPPTIQE